MTDEKYLELVRKLIKLFYRNLENFPAAKTTAEAHQFLEASLEGAKDTVRNEDRYSLSHINLPELDEGWALAGMIIVLFTAKEVILIAPNGAIEIRPNYLEDTEENIVKNDDGNRAYYTSVPFKAFIDALPEPTLVRRGSDGKDVEATITN